MEFFDWLRCAFKLIFLCVISVRLGRGLQGTRNTMRPDMEKSSTRMAFWLSPPLYMSPQKGAQEGPRAQRAHRSVCYVCWSYLEPPSPIQGHNQKTQYQEFAQGQPCFCLLPAEFFALVEMVVGHYTLLSGLNL